MDVAERAEDKGQGGQCPRVADTLELSRREQPPRHVVPDIRCGLTGEREPARLPRWEDGLAPEPSQRLLQDRWTRCVPLGEQDRQTLKEEIGRARLRRLRTRQRGRHCLPPPPAPGPGGRRT